MCGRFTINYTYEEMLEYLKDEYSIFDFDFDLPRYNVAPGQHLLALTYDGDKYRAATFKWGYIPPFRKSEKSSYKMINARSEGIGEKSSFKDSFYNKRCLILSDGFYEWDKKSGSNLPYYITFKDKKMMAYAGLWSRFEKDGKSIYTCTIITTIANKIVDKIHDRMPVVLDSINAKKWISSNCDIEFLENLLNQYPANHTNVIEVSTKVNKVINDDPSLIEEHQEYTLF